MTRPDWPGERVAQAIDSAISYVDGTISQPPSGIAPAHVDGAHLFALDVDGTGRWLLVVIITDEVAARSPISLGRTVRTDRPAFVAQGSSDGPGASDPSWTWLIGRVEQPGAIEWSDSLDRRGTVRPDEEGFYSLLLRSEGADPRLRAVFRADTGAREGLV